MDKRTRVLNAMDGKPVDRVPVGFWHHFSGEDEKGEGSIKAHLRYYREAGLDFVKIMSDGIWLEYGRTITTASDWAHIRPNGKNSAYIRDSVERAKRINDALNGECCTFYNVFAPFTLIRFHVGWDQGMAHILENPGAVVSALNALAEDNAELANRLITEGGCDGIYASVQGGEVDRFTVEEYEELIAPSDLPAILSANAVSNYNVFHLCGYAGVRNQLDIWKKYPARIYNWAVYTENMSLAQGRKYFAPKADCVLGGFDNRACGLLYHGTEAEIKAEAKRIIDDAGKLGTILGADCTIAPDLALERLRWVVEAAEEA